MASNQTKAEITKRVTKYMTKNGWCTHYKASCTMKFKAIISKYKAETVSYVTGFMGPNILQYFTDETSFEVLDHYFEIMERINETGKTPEKDFSWLAEDRYWVMFEKATSLFGLMFAEIRHHFDDKVSTSHIMSYFGISRNNKCAS
jgi:hypothetical protein